MPLKIINKFLSAFTLFIRQKKQKSHRESRSSQISRRRRSLLRSNMLIRHTNLFPHYGRKLSFVKQKQRTLSDTLLCYTFDCYSARPRIFVASSVISIFASALLMTATVWLSFRVALPMFSPLKVM